MDKIWDVLILGGGPAGLSAAIYAGRAKAQVLVVESGRTGGQIAITSEIENYPGALSEDSGASLTDRMVEQAKHFGAEFVCDTIKSVELDGDVKQFHGNKDSYKGKTVILTPGASPRAIGCPGEKPLIGKGVSYCATCDGALFEDFEIYVVGGGDAAVEEAIFLTKFARKVTIIHRRDQLRAAQSLCEKAFNNPKIAFMWDSVVTEIGGDGLVETMTIQNVKTGELTTVTADEEDGTFGVFVFVGMIPQTKMFEGIVDMDGGYFAAGEDMHTNIPGVYVAGDARKKAVRQVVTAAADGAIAALEAGHYVDNH